METITICGCKAKVAKTFLQRTRGLIGTRALPKGEGLLILKCNMIHTCFMSMTIDATFLDKNNNVVKIVRNIKPWRLFIFGGIKATKVLETSKEERGMRSEE